MGAEECYDILVDSDELRRTPLGPVLEWLTPRPDEIPPIVAGIGPLPRPQRFYFRFDAPIETRRWAGRADDQTACLELRAQVAQAIGAPGGMEAVNLKVAEKYVEAFAALARTNNTLILPANLAELGGLIAAAMTVVKSHSAPAAVK